MCNVNFFFNRLGNKSDKLYQACGYPVEAGLPTSNFRWNVTHHPLFDTEAWQRLHSSTYSPYSLSIARQSILAPPTIPLSLLKHGHLIETGLRHRARRRTNAFALRPLVTPSHVPRLRHLVGTAPYRRYQCTCHRRGGCRFYPFTHASSRAGH